MLQSTVVSRTFGFETGATERALIADMTAASTVSRASELYLKGRGGKYLPVVPM